MENERNVKIEDIIGEYKEMIKDLSSEIVELRAYARTLERELLGFREVMNEVKKDKQPNQLVQKVVPNDQLDK
jgi:predicted RNase H-like nuclease (RuvC/YqgF family)